MSSPSPSACCACDHPAGDRSNVTRQDCIVRCESRPLLPFSLPLVDVRQFTVAETRGRECNLCWKVGSEAKQLTIPVILIRMSQGIVSIMWFMYGATQPVIYIIPIAVPLSSQNSAALPPLALRQHQLPFGTKLRKLD